MHNEGHWRPAAASAEANRQTASLYELSRNLARDPNFPGSSAEASLHHRLALHGQHIEERLVLEGVDSTAISRIEPGKETALDISDDRKLTDEQLAARGLPPAGDGEVFHAVVVSGWAGNRTVTAVISEAERRGVITYKRLQDNDIDDGLEFKPKWTPLGNTFADGAPTVSATRNGNGWLLIKTDNGGQENDQNIVIRPKLSKTERVVDAGADYEKGSRKGRKLAIAALALGAAVGVPSAIANVVDSEVPVPREGRIDYEDGQRVEQVGIDRYNEALILFQAGDIDGLQSIIDKSAFGDFHLDEQYIDKVSQASDMQDVAGAVNDALGSVGLDEISLSIPSDSNEKYKGLSASDVDSAKTAALGVLDFVSDMGPLLERPGGLELQIVDELYSDILESGHAQGHYDPVDSGNDIPIIRLVADTTDMPALMAHEYAHDLSQGVHEGKNRPVISKGYISTMNPDGTTYDDYDPKDDPNNDLRIGQEVVSDYGRTNADEDISEIFESLQTGNMPDMFAEEAFTVLKQKTSGIMASTEAVYPGTSAVYFKDKLEATSSSKSSSLEKTADAAESYLQKIRSKAALITSTFMLLAVAAESYGRFQGGRNKIVQKSGRRR